MKQRTYNEQMNTKGIYYTENTEYGVMFYPKEESDMSELEIILESKTEDKQL